MDTVVLNITEVKRIMDNGKMYCANNTKEKQFDEKSSSVQKFQTDFSLMFGGWMEAD